MRTVWDEIYGLVGVIGIIAALVIVAGLIVWLVVGIPAPTHQFCYPHCH